MARQVVDHPPYAIQPVGGRLEGQAAGTEKAGHHSLARQIFENLQDFFALAKGIKEDGHRAQVDGMRAQPNQVRSAARQFRQQHADVLRALRNFHAQNLLHRQAVAQIIRKRRQIIDAVGQGHNLRIGFRLAGFLDAGVQIPNHRLGLDHDFAVHLQNHAQHPVRRRVLRAHIEDHRLRWADRRFDGGGHRYPSVG